MIVTKCHVTYEFQSTHPVRGATACRYPLAYLVAISIHAPREGCDTTKRLDADNTTAFQSTHPVRGATHITITNNGTQIISIHAPREGCDRTRAVNGNDTANFNPRTP